MARTQTEIKKTMADRYCSQPEVIEKYGLVEGSSFDQQFSIVSLENIVFETIAFAIWVFENLLDIFKTEQEAAMARQKIHSREWYRQKALDFKFGIAIVPETDTYDLTGYTDEQIIEASVIKQAACVKLISANGYGILRVKVATANSDGDLIQVPAAQFEALKYYMLRNVVDAGTQLRMTTGPADDLKLKIDIYFDPQVLSLSGARLDGTNDTPVQDAIVAFLKSLDFNGSLIVRNLESSLEKIEGVKIAEVKSAYSRYGTYSYETTDIPNVGLIDAVRVADSGYMKLDEDQLELNFRTNEYI